MSLEEFNNLLEAAMKLEAQEAIILMDVANYGNPNVDNKSRKAIFNKYHKLGQKSKYKKKALDMNQIKSFLNQHKGKIK